jgi:hypothetical protein
MTNALAYSTSILITSVNGFIVQALGEKMKKSEKNLTFGAATFSATTIN